MVISMAPGIDGSRIRLVCQRLQTFGYDHRVVEGQTCAVIAAVGMGDVTSAMQAIEAMDGVVEVLRVSDPWKLASRKVQPGGSVVRVDGYVIGGPEFITMAGPCSVETEPQIKACAAAVSLAGARILRGGAFKPRTSPYAFQGLGEDGLKILRAAAAEKGLSVVTEVMDTRDVDLVARYSDILQIGARNMQNFSLLREVGKIRKPVLLKRGLAATLEELLLSAEYILSEGNPDVILCLRGVRTFETDTRNTFDVADVPVLKTKTHLPIVVDPAHASGKREYVPGFARMGVVSGADGLMVEVAENPDMAWTDGRQSLSFEQLDQMMLDLAPFIQLMQRVGPRS